MTHCVCLLISQLLALKTVDIIQLKQETPYGDTPKPQNPML